MKNNIFLLSLLSLTLLVVSCNKSETIEEPDPPRIQLEQNRYTTKVGHGITITPTIENGEGATYSWIENGNTVARTLAYTFSRTEKNSYYLTFRVETPHGKDEEDIRIDVNELAPPVISFLAADDLEIEVGIPCIFDPVVLNGEEAAYEWQMNGQNAGKEKTYTFSPTEAGSYTISLKVTNEDGFDEKSASVEVTDTYRLNVYFERPGFFSGKSEKPVFTGQPVYLKPIVEDAGERVLEYYWLVNGEAQPKESRTLLFTPDSPGMTEIQVIVWNRLSEEELVLAGTAKVDVICTGDESSRFRVPTGVSSPNSDRVYEYIPAPGQFIQDADLGGFTGAETTHEAAAAYAQRRLSAGEFVSLGAFGGYVAVGFDHSIENKGAYQGYDFAIAGNQYDGSSEPGIVWVMQDANGNGLPDDVWYELKGSEWDAAETDAEYAVTYYRPTAPQSAVAWTDNRGGSGTVEYHGQFHDQPSYYPAWLPESYTLRGPLLKSRNRYENNQWINGSYDWGYADNWGSDRLGENGGEDGDARNVYFKISNAVLPDGTPANLQYIDFIKVQTAVQAKSGITGELSTEVMSFRDMNL